VIRIGGGYPPEKPDRRRTPRQARPLNPAELEAAQARRRPRRPTGTGEVAAGVLWFAACCLAAYLIMGL